jgi:hypothetical protein
MKPVVFRPGWRHASLVAAMFIATCPMIARSQLIPSMPELSRISDLAATKSICVATLRKRHVENTVAYLVFEIVKPLWGEKAAQLLVLPQPEYRPGGEGPSPIMTQADIDALREGGLYVIRFSDLELLEWRPLNDPGGAPAAAMTEAMEKADRAMRLDPWPTAGLSGDYERAAALVAARRASAPVLEGVLRQYGQSERPTTLQLQLVREILARTVHEKLPLSGEALEAVCAQVAGEKRTDAVVTRLIGQIMSDAVALLGGRLDGRYDRLIVDWLRGPDEQLRLAAIEILRTKHVPDAVPVLWEQLRADRKTTAIGLQTSIVRQQGAAGITELINFYRDHRDLLTGYDGLNIRGEARAFFNETHIAGLKELDVARNRPFHSRTIELLLWAGDPQAGAAAETAAARGEFQLNLADDDETIQKFAKELAPAARAILQRRAVDGAAINMAAVILKRAKDPALPDLLAAATTEPWLGYWALQHLQTVCQEKHRPILERFAALQLDPPDGAPPARGRGARGGAARRPGSDLEYRIYGLAGLARLGDDQSMRLMTLTSFLAPQSHVRYVAARYVLPTFKADQLIAAWQAAPPDKADEIAVAVHEFVLGRLKELKQP